MLYKYEATVLRVVDGDTVELNIDLGFTIHWKSNCRLYGINTPELRSKDVAEREKAIQAKEYVMNRLKAGEKYLIESQELDKYGRPLIILWIDGINFNKELISKGLAVEYYG